MTRPAEHPAPARRIDPRPHDSESFIGTPYYDEALDVPQSEAHMAMVIELGSVLRGLAGELGYTFHSDNPIWYLHIEDDEQRVGYPDLALMTPGTAVERSTAEEARWVAEVVSTTDRRKELKDTRFQLALNEYNGVPEFALLFPELDDPRALRFHRLEDGRYQELDVGPGASVRSEAVPGLELRVLPRAEWREGRKVEVLYEGVRRPPLDEALEQAEAARARARAAEAKAEEERARAEEERARADSAEARTEALLAQLRALGVDPEGE